VWRGMDAVRCEPAHGNRDKSVSPSDWGPCRRAMRAGRGKNRGRPNPCTHLLASETLHNQLRVLVNPHLRRGARGPGRGGEGPTCQIKSRGKHGSCGNAAGTADVWAGGRLESRWKLR